jgi:nicotinic acid mononucleotide adenylyltransferase
MEAYCCVYYSLFLVVALAVVGTVARADTIGVRSAEIRADEDTYVLNAEFDLAVVARRLVPGEPSEAAWPAAVQTRLTPLPLPDGALPLGAGGRVVTLEASLPAVSSRQVRARLSAGAPVDDLVPARVARYIQMRRLYRQEATR